MITEEKIHEVKKQLKRGTPAGEIREAMMHEGYSAEDIEQCFVARKADMRSWFLFFAIVFFCAGLWAWNERRGFLFQGLHWKLFLLSAGLFIGHYWPAQKKKNEENG
ncbi:MAG: hypothetical protein ABI402_04195 [Ferruginibacter sp.]